ncbi:hypothetical protein OG345_23450 [Streptomyces sp. NBC_01220]|uniref:hypothetical protein n=1 Tax=Streptomyces sp. NBC_01220 TaxID=2903781 RepID=UPI00352D8A12|nr:hypothetical protein OG345_23450 [Streptomyces sp. NBC_01220]
MITFLISFLIDQLLTPGLPGRRRRERSQERAFADGGEVTFQAYVLGDRPYCRPVPVFLSASRTALHVSPTEVKELRRSVLPAERIAVQRIRGRERTDPRTIPSYWQLAECRDGQADILIACDPTHMRYVDEALGAT